MELKITCACPDISELNENSISDLIDQHQDSDILVLPEYLLEIAGEPKKSFPQQLIFLGSEIDLNFSKTKISLNGDYLSYSKQRLTVQEKQFNPGSENICIHYKGAKIGLAVCFEIEFPEFVDQWRKEDFDVLIVPAATETTLGYERVNRCASARSVELGCAVVTCHLIGDTKHDLLGKNVGNHHLYLPSQTLFESDSRFETLKEVSSGELVRHFTLDVDKVREQRKIQSETNPAL